MKLHVSKSELIEIAKRGVKRALNEVYEEGKTVSWKENDYIKANRKGSRDAEREMRGPGFKQTSKVHKGQKNYNRKGRDKNSWRNEIDENESNLLGMIEEIVSQEMDNNKNTPMNNLASKLIQVTKDGFLSEPDDYGFNSNELERALVYNDYKIDNQLLKRIISYLSNYDIILFDETTGKIDINNSNNPEAAKILLKMQELLTSY